MKHAFALLLGAILALPALAQAPPEIHSKHFCFGYPTGTPESNGLIIRDCYALSSNDKTKLADWVAYRLTPHEVMGTLDLERDFRNDPDLDPAETLEADPASQDDYKGAFAAQKYERGHFAPLGSFKGSRHASQVNYYSNIAPMKSDLNGGPWQELESAVRLLTMRYGEVWVMTGPLYETEMPKLPAADEEHTVPSGFWKVVLVRPKDQLTSIRVASFIMPQTAERKAKIGDFLVTLKEIQERSKLDLLRLLPDDLEKTLEADRNRVWVGEEFVREPTP